MSITAPSDGRHAHLLAHHRLVHRDRQIEADIVAVAREEAVRLHLDRHDRVARAARPRSPGRRAASGCRSRRPAGSFRSIVLPSARVMRCGVERRGILEGDGQAIADVGALAAATARAAEAAPSRRRPPLRRAPPNRPSKMSPKSPASPPKSWAPPPPGRKPPPPAAPPKPNGPRGLPCSSISPRSYWARLSGRTAGHRPTSARRSARPPWDCPGYGRDEAPWRACDRPS